MTDNGLDVLLISTDDDLVRAVRQTMPAGARFAAVPRTPAPTVTAIRQAWVDIDGAAAFPRELQVERRVYFYSRQPDSTQEYPPGLFFRKPPSAASLTLLWASATEQRDHARRMVEFPGWITLLHEIELRECCNRCISVLPERLGYENVALYLYEPAQRSLSLAESNCRFPVDLAIPVSEQSTGLLAAACLAREFIATDDLRESAAARGLIAPALPGGADARSAVVAPLVDGDDLVGLAFLVDRKAGPLSDPSAPIREVLDFAARCLRHARLYDRTRAEGRVDGLTGLYNYRWMIETLSREIRRSERYGEPLSLLMLDLDGLKPVNDRHGHLAGDAALRHVANRVSSVLRQTDSAARIGGDEFVVMLPSTDTAGAQLVAERLIAMLNDDPALVGDALVPVTVSLGLAEWQTGWDVCRLLEAADKAMYCAKRAGRARLVCHESAG